MTITTKTKYKIIQYYDSRLKDLNLIEGGLKFRIQNPDTGTQSKSTYRYKLPVQVLTGTFIRFRLRDAYKNLRDTSEFKR